MCNTLEHGLSILDSELLQVIRRNPGLTISQLAERQDWPESLIAAQIDTLQSKELVGWNFDAGTTTFHVINAAIAEPPPVHCCGALPVAQ